MLFQKIKNLHPQISLQSQRFDPIQSEYVISLNNNDIAIIVC